MSRRVSHHHPLGWLIPDFSFAETIDRISVRSFGIGFALL